MRFVFLLTFWTADTPAPDVFVVASDLTGAQCVEMMQDWQGIEKHGVPSCEFDLGELDE